MENLKKVKETILELIYPSKCPFCGEIVSAGKKHSTEHNGICKACREKLPYIGEVRCMCCGKPLTDPEEEYCYDCTSIFLSMEEASGYIKMQWKMQFMQ